MEKEDFPPELEIIGFFVNEGKATKREVAEALGISVNEGPTKRWRDKLDSILRRLHKQSVLDRQLVTREGYKRTLFEYHLHPEMIEITKE